MSAAPASRAWAWWERVLGFLALVAADVSPFTWCMFPLFLGAALSLAWLAVLPRSLSGPSRGPWSEVARVALIASIPTLAGLIGVANAGITRAALPWLLVRPDVAAGGCVIAGCLAVAAATRSWLAPSAARYASREDDLASFPIDIPLKEVS